MRLAPTIVLGMLLAAGAAALTVFSGAKTLSPEEFNGTLVQPAMSIEDFTLEAPAGRFTAENLRGSLALVTFGFTNCPHICPMTMTRLAKAAAVGEERGENAPGVVLITVDPERDSPQEIDEFAKKFHPEFMGVSGSLEQIRGAANAFGVYFEKEQSAENGASYLMGHSTSVFALNGSGNITAVWSGDAAAEQIAADIERL